MKAIATLSLLGVALTAEDHEFSIINKLLQFKKPHKPVAQQPTPVSQPSGEEYINYPSLEDDELMTLPYYRLPIDRPIIKPILSPTFPDPELPGFPDLPIKRPVFYEDADYELFVPNGVYKKPSKETVSLDNFLMEALAVLREADERDQLVQEVLDVVRDVLTPDEVDEATLVSATEEYVDESLEINSYFKKKEERREMDERDQLVQEMLDVVKEVLTPDEVDEATLVKSTEEYVDESLEINSYSKKKEERKEMDERDQLIQEVLDVVRDVLTPDEVDEATLVSATEEYVDESLEINGNNKSNMVHDHFFGNLKNTIKEKVNNLKDNMKSLFNGHHDD